MMAMSRLAPDAPEALSSSLIRAKMCELCAARNGANAAVAFTAGLLSALPGALDRPIEDIVEQLALAAELRLALLEHAGPVGQVLAWVLGYEAGDQRLLAALGAPPTIANAFIDAVQWSTELTGALTRTQRTT
jgi:EAL and modified HD-GYP domain-containing signal transduction protein